MPAGACRRDVDVIPILATVGFVLLLTAVAFAAVGHRFHSRPVGTANLAARTAFVTWWWAFAAYLAGQGFLDVAAAYGYAPLQAHFAFRLMVGPLLSLAAWGLAFHIVFLWSGRGGWAFGLAAYYAAAAGFYDALVWLGSPNAVVVTDWAAALSYDVPPSGLLWNATLATIGLPLVLGSAAYLGLLREVADREQRYRIMLVGGSLLVWVVSGFAAEVAGSTTVRFVAIVVLGLLTSGAVVAAYHPPGPIARWLERPTLQGFGMQADRGPSSKR